MIALDTDEYTLKYIIKKTHGKDIISIMINVNFVEVFINELDAVLRKRIFLLGDE